MEINFLQSPSLRLDSLFLVLIFGSIRIAGSAYGAPELEMQSNIQRKRFPVERSFRPLIYLPRPVILCTQSDRHRIGTGSGIIQDSS